MISVQKAKLRRHQICGGQATWRSFRSDFGEGSASTGFRTLVSFREEHLAPGASFENQDLRDLEILTYVLEGAVILEDTRGRTVALEAGEFHRASLRSETVQRGTNGLGSSPARVFQGFVTTDRGVLQTPSEKRRYPIAERRGVLRLVVSRSGQQSSLRVRQDAAVYSSVLDRGHHLIHELAPGRGAWLVVVEGRIQLGEEDLESGDSVSFVEEPAVSLTAQDPSEILLFDLR